MYPAGRAIRVVQSPGQAQRRKASGTRASKIAVCCSEEQAGFPAAPRHWLFLLLSLASWGLIQGQAAGTRYSVVIPHVGKLNSGSGFVLGFHGQWVPKLAFEFSSCHSVSPSITCPPVLCGCPEKGPLPAVRGAPLSLLAVPQQHLSH